MTQILEILVGLPASGKSTYAQRLADKGTHVRVNWDMYRWYDSAGNPKHYVFNKENEQFIKATALGAAEIAAQNGKHIVADNANLTAEARQYWIDFAQKWNMQPVITSIDTPLEECIRRNSLRTGWQRVPRAVVEWMALVNPQLDGLNRTVWPADKKSVIVDIDGTLADSSVREQYVIKRPCPVCSGLGRVPPGTSVVDMFKYANAPKCLSCKGTGQTKKDWDRFYAEVGKDNPRKPVAEWTKMLHDEGYNIVVVSGRPVDKAGIATEDWLARIGCPYDRLYMRPGGSKEDDTVIKKTILDAISPHTKIAFAIDDRPRVIRMWRENGIKTYDVGKGVEF